MKVEEETSSFSGQSVSSITIHDADTRYSIVATEWPHPISLDQIREIIRRSSVQKRAEGIEYRNDTPDGAIPGEESLRQVDGVWMRERFYANEHYLFNLYAVSVLRNDTDAEATHFLGLLRIGMTWPRASFLKSQTPRKFRAPTSHRRCREK